MSKKDIKQKPSETALMGALHRAIANKENGSQILGSDNLAEFFLPLHYKFFIGFKKIRANSKNKLNKVLPGMHEYVIARTAFFDSLFIEALNSRIPQIVLLGAGYDSRAYRFAKLNTATKIFELDIATTQNRKMKSLIKARIDIPKNVELVPIDFNNESLHKVLEKAGYNRHERTLFLWKGWSIILIRNLLILHWNSLIALHFKEASLHLTTLSQAQKVTGMSMEIKSFSRP